MVTEVALSPAFATDRTLFACVLLTDASLFVRSTDAGRSFTYVGSPMSDSPPAGFAFSPDFVADRTAFAAHAGTGLWRTTDGGDSWHPANAGLAGTQVQGVAVSPLFAADRRVLVATAQGLFVSHDGGGSWAPPPAAPAEPNLRRVAFVLDGAGGLQAFAAGSSFHRSLDGGLGWETTGQFAKPVESLAAVAGAVGAQVLVSFGRFGLGVAHSADGGTHFAPLDDGLTDPFVEEVAIAGDGTLFAVTDTDGCFRAAAAGAPWQLVVEGFEEPSDLTLVHHTEVVPSPAFASDRTVFVGAYEGLYRSEDAGEAWRQLDVYSQRLSRRFVLSPQFASDAQVLLGNYGGAVFHYREAPFDATGARPGGPAAAAGAAGASAAAGAGVPSAGGALPPPTAFAWEPRGTNLTAPWASVLVASPGALGERTLAYGYTNLKLSTDEGLTWGPASKPAGVSVVRALAFSPDFARDGVMFLGSVLEGSFRSADGGQSWTAIAGLPAALSTTAIAVSPGFPGDGTLFFASRSHGVQRSLDGGAGWAAANFGLPGPAIKALQLSPAFVLDRFAVAGHDEQGVWVSTDGGSSWQSANAGLPEGALRVESLAVSPAFAADRTLFVALQNQGVWRSRNAGLTWQPSGPGLPAPPVELALSPAFAKDRTVIVGTYGGTMISRDAGASWQPLPGYIRADNTHPTVDYGGPWTTVADATQFVGGLAVTAAAGAFTELEFHGRRIAWVAHRAPDAGIALVQVDGEPPVAVDTWSAQHEPQSEVFVRTFPEAGWHAIRVTHSGQANPHAGGAWLRSDGFAWQW